MLRRLTYLTFSIIKYKRYWDGEIDVVNMSWGHLFAATSSATLDVRLGHPRHPSIVLAISSFADTCVTLTDVYMQAVWLNDIDQ